MFTVNSKIKKPNHALAWEHALAWAERGFRFNSNAWREMTDSASEKYAQLQRLGLKKPDSPQQIEWFLRSFNSLEIAAQLYDLKKAKWNLTVDALCELTDKFASVPELKLLFEYKQVQATARSFSSLERQLKDGGIAYPKVKLTATNRIMFVEPFISGLPKACRPFLPIDDSSVLLSVDVKAQEPSIIVNWFGSDGLRRISATETDIYTGVAKAAFIPHVKAYEAAGVSVTEVNSGGTWLWGSGDALLRIEDVYQAVFGLPELVVGVFESGERRMLPVRWGETVKGVAIGEILPGALSYRLLPEERDEAKRVWNLLANGGAKVTAKTSCTAIDGGVLANYIKAELNASPPKLDKGGVYTYFDTPLPSEKNTNYRALNNRAVQGTGADLMALLIEQFYSGKRPDGLDIYFTRYDELVMQVPTAFIDDNGGGEGVGDYFRDIFEHTIDEFSPFRVDVEVF